MSAVISIYFYLNIHFTDNFVLLNVSFSADYFSLFQRVFPRQKLFALLNVSFSADYFSLFQRVFAHSSFFVAPIILCNNIMQIIKKLKKLNCIEKYD